MEFSKLPAPKLRVPRLPAPKLPTPAASARSLTAVLLMLAGLVPSSAFAEGSEGGLRLNGFGTVGLMHVDAPSPWVYRREYSGSANTSASTRWDVDSRIGLQAVYPIRHDLEAMAQVVMRKLPRHSPPISYVDWAYLAWRPVAAVTLRVGRIGPDQFLMSDYRNVGYAYETVRPPVEIYGTLSARALNGLDIAWDTGSGSGIGAGSEAGLGAPTRWRTRLVLADPEDVRIDGGPGQESARLALRRSVLLSTQRESGPVTLRANFLRVWTGAPENAQLTQLRDALDQFRQLPVPAVSASANDFANRIGNTKSVTNMFTLAGVWDSSNWILRGEVLYLNRQLSSGGSEHGAGGYAMVGRRIGSWTPYTMISGARLGRTAEEPQWQQLLAPVIGAQAAAQAQQVGSAAATALNMQALNQRTASLGARWDFVPSAALKLQYDYITVRENGAGLWARGDLRSGRAHVLSATVDFVF